MLAPEDDDRTTNSRGNSLASDIVIVELVVLSGDDAFLQTLREAVGPSRRLWHILSSDKIGDMLLAGEVGILVLDVHALRQPAAPFITQIKKQFPDLVIVVAGTRDTEAELARLISNGLVYRFIHKPMSPARARLFAEAAVKRYEDQRRRSGAATLRSVSPVRTGGLMLFVGGCAAICAIAGGLWVLTRDNRQAAGPAPPATNVTADAAVPADSPPVPPSADGGLLARASQALAANRLTASGGDSALELYSQALALNPGNSDARLGIAAVRERLLARAVNAMMEDRLDEAAAAIETARRAGAPGGRISLLTAELTKARLQAKTAAYAGRDKAAGGVANGAANGGGIEHKDYKAGAERRTAEPPTDEDHADAAAAQGPATATATAAPAPAAGTTAGSPAGNAAAPPTAEPAAIIDSGKLVVVKSVPPDYPREARAASTEGWVELDFTVTASGHVKDVSVHAANPPGVFEHVAVNALSRWQYKPVVIDARPVSQRARIRIRFALAG